MRSTRWMPIFAVAVAVACGDGGDAGEGAVDEAAPASETAPVVVDSSVMTTPGEMDTVAAPVPMPDDDTAASPSPPEAGKDSLPAGATTGPGKGKGRP